MFRHHAVTKALSFTALLGAISCSNRSPEVNCVGSLCPSPGANSNASTTTTSTGSTGANASASGASSLRCNAGLDANQVTSGTLHSLLVTATGGLAPYSVPGQITNFGASATLSGVFNNSTTNNIVLTRTVTVKDSAGASAFCNFSVTVAAAGSNSTTGSTGTSGSNGSSSNGLYCTMTASNYTPRINDIVNFNIKAGGGSTSTYSFDPFYADVNSNPAAGMVVSSNEITAKGQYTSTASGVPYTASIKVRNGSDVAVCSVSISPLSPKLVLSGTSSGSLTSTRTIVALASGFLQSDLPRFIATSSDPGILATVGIDPVNRNNIITVQRANASDTRAHLGVNIQVTALSNNGDRAIASMRLDFTATAINCNLIVAGAAFSNSDLQFTVNSNEATDLYITEYSSTPDARWKVSTPKSNSILVNFAKGGDKIVALKAYSPSQNLYCNNGAALEQVVHILSRLSTCSVSASPASTYFNTPVTITGVLPADSGPGPFLVKVTVSSTQNPWGRAVPISPPSGLSAVYQFLDPGSYHVEMTISDSSNQSISCDTYETVTGDPGLQVESYALNWGDRSFVLSADSSLTPGSSGWFGGSPFTTLGHFIVSLIDVPRADPTWVNFPGVNRVNSFALVYHGRILISETGTYDFRVTADDGIILLLDGSVVPGLSIPGLQDYTRNYGSKYFAPNQLGWHPFLLKYWQGPGGYGLNAAWKKPSDRAAGVDYQTIPAAAFIRND